MRTKPNYVIGDALDELRKLPDEFAQCCVTSPPYWGLRDYGVEGQLGLEPTPDEYVAKLVATLQEVRRVLRSDGTLWLNLGDSYASSGGAHGGRTDNQRGVGAARVHAAGGGDQGGRKAPSGLKPKDMVGIPWCVAFALRADGWYLRSEIIWAKPTPMPEAVKDRPTKAHEHIFLLTRLPTYHYDAEAIKERTTGGAHPRGGGVNSKARESGTSGSRQNASFSAAVTETVERRNKRTVWTVQSTPYSGAHFACFPPKLIEPCIMAGCPEGGMVIDPFLGSGTVGEVCEALGRQWFGIELNPDYEPLIQERTKQLGLFGRR